MCACRHPPPYFLSAVVVVFLVLPSLHIACEEQESQQLRAFLTALLPADNASLPASWDVPDCCQWDGVVCDAGGAVTRVWLPSRGLAGVISPSLANMTGLTHLNLSCNRLTGPLPAALLFSSSIVVIDVSSNHLSGVLPKPPATMPRRLPLQVLNIASNSLSPQPASALFGPFDSLKALNISCNRFTGSLPASLCTDMPLLEILDISSNNFSGVITAGLGNCSELRVLFAGKNNLQGPLPDDLFTAPSLKRISLPYNQLTGTLDDGHIVNLAGLVFIDLGWNSFTGELPESIGQLRKLEVLHLNSNLFTGMLPRSLSNCTSLQYLDLRANNFSGDLAGVDFSKLTNLTILDLFNNNFTGKIPASIYSLNMLIALRLANNKLQDQVAPQISNLRDMTFLSLTSNSLKNLSGLFWNIRNCENITALLIGDNFFNEAMPVDDWLADLPNLNVLVLEGCQLSGEIPGWLSKLNKLAALDLSRNKLTGSIPIWIGNMPSLIYLDLSDNLLSGKLPLSITMLPAISSEQAFRQLNPAHAPLAFSLNPQLEHPYNQLQGVPPTVCLSSNNLDGVIYPEFHQLKLLQVLSLGHNNLSGVIPQELSNLTELAVIDLSVNFLSGMIPPALAQLNYLSSFNVAYNNLEGPIPTGGQFASFPVSSFEGNPLLCGSADLKPCVTASKEPVATVQQIGCRILVAIILGTVFGGAFILVLMGCIILNIRAAMRGKRKTHDENRNGAICSLDTTEELLLKDVTGAKLVMLPENSENLQHLSFGDILSATNNFHHANAIGRGGFGTVFKAELQNGTMLAIKKLSGDMFLMEKQFRAEVETLSKAKHENLVPLLGYCIHGKLRLLIYPFMKKGSLDEWLHGTTEPEMVLDWPMRLKIVKGASRGLMHMHQNCRPQIIHRDIKSSNILLNEEFEGHIADFGLAKLIDPQNTHVTTEMVGTLGYIPPEYGQSWKATTRGDIYSFGIVLLELLTRRRPIGLPNACAELAGWVQEKRTQDKLHEVFDPLLNCNDHEEQMLCVLNLASRCIQQDPSKRPSIQEVVSWLEKIDN